MKYQGSLQKEDQTHSEEQELHPPDRQRVNHFLPEEAEHQPVARQEVGTQPLYNNKSKHHKKSYIDDLTLLEKILLSDLEVKEGAIGPPNYHYIFHLMLP